MAGTVERTLARLPDLSTAGARWRALAQLIGLLVVVAYAVVFVRRGPWDNDAYGFWAAWDGGLYDMAWLFDHGAYVYSPAFAQAIAPLAALPWEAFWLVWLLLQFGALLLLAGPLWSAVILLLPWPSIEGYANAVPATIYNGNPQLLLALAIAAGLRWPGAWAVPLLTKVTPGIGVLWFGLRGEWRRLAIAVGVTLGVVAVSFVLAPTAWIEWIGLLGDSARANTLAKEPILRLPLLARLPIALLLLAWGARTDRYWTVPIAAMLALPAIQLGGFAIAVAAVPFLGLPLAPRWPVAGCGRVGHTDEDGGQG